MKEKSLSSDQGAFSFINSRVFRAFKGRKGGGLYGILAGLAFDQFVGRSAFDPIADFGGGVIRDFTGMGPVIEGLNMDTQQTQQLFTQTDDDNVNVFVVNGEQRASINSTGIAEQVSTLPGVSSANPDNPYILNSIIEYNIIGV